MRPGLLTRFCVYAYVLAASPVGSLSVALADKVCHPPVQVHVPRLFYRTFRQTPAHPAIKTHSVVFRGSYSCAGREICDANPCPAGMTTCCLIWLIQ
jgi:hypothetical protein